MLTDNRVFQFRFKVVSKRNGHHTTICLATLGLAGYDNPQRYGATAKCWAGDHYNKAIGKAKALGRVLAVAHASSLGIGRLDRKRVFYAFYASMAKCPDVRAVLPKPKPVREVAPQTVVEITLSDGAPDAGVIASGTLPQLKETVAPKLRDAEAKEVPSDV
jgi:hypothetical protein